MWCALIHLFAAVAAVFGLISEHILTATWFLCWTQPLNPFVNSSAQVAFCVSRAAGTQVLELVGEVGC